MQIQVQRWGNSLAVRIPKSLALDTKIVHGSFVNLALVKGKLVVTPVSNQEYFLEQLLAGISAQNLHTGIDAGKAVGKEVW